MNKKKIINDPLYGLISIPDELVYDIIEHAYFQRLRRIKQLGLTDYVYPGATHTRFHHAIGAMYLMSRALDTLRQKGVEISEDEYQASLVAVLLHDAGHGPFSHTLEYSLLHDIPHEKLSLVIIEKFNELFNNELTLAIRIFKNQYHRSFFHQLVSSQLDVDRLDYLSRDSFFTGVSEGTVGVDRIIKLICVIDDQLMVEEKGIYSLENFLSARRLMYWQVYFHKTTVGIEKMLVRLIQRAKFLVQSGESLTASSSLLYFLKDNITIDSFADNNKYLEAFLELDDYDIWSAIKFWQHHEDYVLSILSKMILKRNLFKVRMAGKTFDAGYIDQIKEAVKSQYHVSDDESQYLIMNGIMSNAAYISEAQTIKIISKSGEIIDLAEATDLPNIKAMSKIVKKYYLCWPKSLSL